jgi:plasmid stability protein
MSSITLKDVPEDLLVRLRAAAARDRRSLNQQALMLIDSGLAARETAEERAHRQVEAWRALAGAWVSDGAFEDDVADLYAARTSGRDVEL